MNNLKIHITLMALFHLISLTFYAQNKIQGDIENWSKGKASLLFSDDISREKVVMGNISSDGRITIPLDEDYLSNLKIASEKAKEKAPQGWEMKFKSLESTFRCKEEGIIYKNSTMVISALPDLEVVRNVGQSPLGRLYCTNEPKLATWLSNNEKENAIKGFYLKWFFIENKASVTGSCNTLTYTGNDNENYKNTIVYDLELQKGWNIIKYSITETFRSQKGKIMSSKIEIKKIDKIPDDAQWLLLSI